jgi:hypothetical protein
LIRNLLYRLLLVVVEDFPGGMTTVFGYTALIRFALVPDRDGPSAVFRKKLSFEIHFKSSHPVMAGVENDRRCYPDVAYNPQTAQRADNSCDLLSIYLIALALALFPGGFGKTPGRHDDRSATWSLDWDRRERVTPAS